MYFGRLRIVVIISKSRSTLIVNVRGARMLPSMEHSWAPWDAKTAKKECLLQIPYSNGIMTGGKINIFIISCNVRVGCQNFYGVSSPQSKVNNLTLKYKIFDTCAWHPYIKFLFIFWVNCLNSNLFVLNPRKIR